MSRYKYDSEQRKRRYRENINREKFYNSKKWKRFRDRYIQSVKGLCEKCKEKDIIRPGENLHHIEHLTEENVKDAKVSLNDEKVIYLCIECHNIEHDRDYKTNIQKIKEQKSEKRKYYFDKDGNLIKNDDYNKDKDLDDIDIADKATYILTENKTLFKKVGNICKNK